MSVSACIPGEIVEVTIRGTVLRQDRSELCIEYPLHDGQPICLAVRIDSRDVTVRRISPPGWPPQPGDLWTDRHGDPWFASDEADDHDSAEEIVMVPGRMWEQNGTRTPDQLLESAGPLTLAYRQPAGGEAR